MENRNDDLITRLLECLDNAVQRINHIFEMYYGRGFQIGFQIGVQIRNQIRRIFIPAEEPIPAIDAYFQEVNRLLHDEAVRNPGMTPAELEAAAQRILSDTPMELGTPGPSRSFVERVNQDSNPSQDPKQR